MERTATTSDSLLDGKDEFYQRALVELGDGRFVELALDGLTDVVPWSEQVQTFNAIIESVRISGADPSQGSPQ